MSELKNIPLEKIRENPDALRAVARDTEQFRELVDSVAAVGILNPINVRQVSGSDEYVLVDGLHRYTAAQEAGLKEIPAQVVEMDDVAVYEAQIIANVHKVDTRPIEYTRGLLRILGARPEMTQSELAKKIGKSPAWLSERLRLLKLDSKIQQLVDEGQIKLMNAHALAKLPPEEQANFVDKAITDPSSEFLPAVEARAKQLREDRSKGKQSGPQEWEPTAHLRKLSALKMAREDDTVASLVKKHGVSDPVEAGRLMLDWVLNMDPEGVQEQRMKHEQRSKEREEAKKRREAERLAQKAKEAAEKAAAATE